MMLKKKNDINFNSSQEVLSEDAAEIQTGNEKVLSDSDALSLDDLKDITYKIINGEANELDISVKGEMAELLRLLMEVKTRVDDIPPSVLSSQQELPRVAFTLTDVNQTTEKAAFNLLENAKGMSGFYQSLLDGVESMRETIEAQDNAAFESQKSEMVTLIEQADDLGFRILEALEFQDITEQKINKVIRSVEEMGARLATLVGFMKPSFGSSKEKNDYDNLLSDFGFA